HWDGEFEKIDDLVRARLNVRFTFEGSQYGGGPSPDVATPSLLSTLLRSATPLPVESLLALTSSDASPVQQGGPSVPVRTGMQFLTRAFAETASEPVRDSMVSDSLDVLPAVPTAEDVFGRVDGRTTARSRRSLSQRPFV